MRKYFEKVIKSKEARANELREEIRNAQTADEVRALGETLDAILTELQEAKEQLDEVNKQNDGEGDNGDGQTEPDSRSFEPMRAMGTTKMSNGEQRSELKGVNSMEYRSAFKDYVLRGTPIPQELRENTLTSDIGSVIPTVIVDKIITKLEEVGKIYGEVTKTAYNTGVQIPIANFNVTAEIVNEGAGSTPIKSTTGSITFTKFKLRCEISMSMEASVMSVDTFETKFVEQVVNAMIKKIDELIINGKGSTEPKGILAETPLEGQALEFTEVNYKTLCDAEGAIPEEYEADVKWCMNKKTFMSLMALTDSTGQPIARINYGIAGKPERTILGRDVLISKHIKDLADENVFAFLFNFKDYVLNTVYDMGIQRKQDWDTEDLRTKAVMSIDGKVVQKESLVTLKKKA